jgi:type II secretory pathway pseudopilin PulG
MNARTPNGFILIELVTTLILVGFIGAFVGLFLNTGINGFLASKRNSEAALKAQFALDRISAELRQIKSWPGLPSTTDISYQSRDLTGTRRMRYDGTAKTIYFRADSGATEYPLLDQVASFNISYTHADMDQLDNDDEISSILINFTIADVPGTFSVRIYPRTPIPYP